MVQPAIIWRRRTSSAGSRSDGLALGAVLGKKRVHLLRPADPFCPVTLAGQLGFQLVIREHRPALEVDSHHLARADAATFDDALFRHTTTMPVSDPAITRPSSVTT